MPSMTLLDVARINADDMVRPLLDDTELALPELANIFAEDIDGMSFKSLVRKKLPSVRYAKFGQGSDPVAVSDELQTFECHYLPGRIEVPESVADATKGGHSRALANQMKAVLAAAFNHMTRCLYYGTSIDGDAPPGLLEVVLPSKTINAGGSSGTTSVVAIRAGVDDVSWIFGNGGRITAGDPRKETIQDANGKKMEGWVQALKGYIGHCIRRPGSIAIINNVDATHPVTDEMLTDLKAKFKASAQMTHLFMTTGALAGYTKSRITTYNKDAQTPLSFGRVPILETDALDLDENDGTTATELEAQREGESFIAP